MKKNFVLITCLILALTFILGACQKTGSETSAVSTSSCGNTNEHGGYDEASGKYYVKLPELELSKSEFNVLVVDNTKETTYYSEEVGVDKYETTDKALEDAVRNRNNRVLEDYGVTIKAVYTANVATDLSNDVKSDTGAYDMAMPFLTGCVTLAQSGEIYDFDKRTDFKIHRFVHALVGSERNGFVLNRPQGLLYDRRYFHHAEDCFHRHGVQQKQAQRALSGYKYVSNGKGWQVDARQIGGDVKAGYK
jgi:hypothetical protein